MVLGRRSSLLLARAFAVAVAVAVGSAGCGGHGHARSASAPASAPKVRVRFSGVHAMPEAALAARVRCDKEVLPKPEAAYERLPNGGVRIHSLTTFDDLLDGDRFEMELAYADFGYLAARVSRPVATPSADGRFLDVVIAVEEGPRFRVGRVDIYEVDAAGQPVAEPLEGIDLRGRLRAAPGDWFSRNVLVDDLAAIRTFYRDRGYAGVEDLPDMKTDAARAIVDVTIPVRRGPLVRVESVRIVTTLPLAIVRPLVSIREGQLYSETEIEESKRRLLALGRFTKVEVTIEQGTDAEKTKITFDLVEDRRPAH